MKKKIAILALVIASAVGCVYPPNNTGCALVKEWNRQGLASYHGEENQWRFGFTDGGDSFVPIIVHSPEEDTCWEEK